MSGDTKTRTESKISEKPNGISAGLLELSKAPQIDDYQFFNPQAKVAGFPSKIEQQLLEHIHEDWTISAQLAEKLPSLPRQTIKNNLMRLLKRNLLEYTHPLNVRYNGVNYAGVRLWRRKA